MGLQKINNKNAKKTDTNGLNSAIEISISEKTFIGAL